MDKDKKRKTYEKPAYKEQEIFERLSLACGKC